MQGVRALVTTPWKGKAYRPLVIRQLESYYVDTALDNDADMWTMDIGDPDGIYLPMINRDHEVRVQLFGVGYEQKHFLVTGIADTVQYDSGVWTLTGRDLSSLATDSDALPYRWKHVRAWKVVETQARKLGFQRMQLSRAGEVKKSQYTDGSESYWDFWYRLYRKEKMWLWTEPSGLLVAGRLNYSKNPSYYLGDSRLSDSAAIQRQVIPVTAVTLTKNTQNRIYETVVYGQRGKTGFTVTARDPAMASWLKQPRKVMLDTTSRSAKQARKTGWEEIFESKVGSVEYKVTIPDPGFVIPQNTIVRLYLSEIGLHGLYFVVGSRVQGGAQGFIQEIRLRERRMAVSARVPSDPKLKTGELGSSDIYSSVASAIEQSAGIPAGWGDYFVKAAKKFHGIMDYSLFLACLLGICRVESHFFNERQNGGPGGDHIAWYPWDSYTHKISPGPGGSQKRETLYDYQEKFANQIGSYGLTQEMGVGPMQLTSRNLKYAADDMLRKNFRNEFTGGRWRPEYNIWIAAQSFATDLAQLHSTRDADIWIGVDAYNRGVGGAQSYFSANGRVSSYAATVKKYVTDTNSGYLALVTSAVQEARQAQAAGQDGLTSGTFETVTTPYGFPKVQEVQRFWNSYSYHFASESTRRKAIVYAALWGYYNKPSIHYSEGSQRMKDFNPPPNVPGNTDCSGFATWCYKSADVSDPNGLGYDGTGNTTTLWNYGSATSYSALKLGDLVFYTNPAHVGIYIGSGYICELGNEQGPNIVKVNYRSDLKGYRSYFVP